MNSDFKSVALRYKRCSTKTIQVHCHGEVLDRVSCKFIPSSMAVPGLQVTAVRIVDVVKVAPHDKKKSPSHVTVALI